MSTASEGALPEPVAGVRVGDEDRARAIARLRDAVGEGRLDLDELEQRIAVAYDARTRAELDAVTADLPSRRDPAPRAPAPRATDIPAFRMHLTVYGLVMGMLVVIWLLGGAGLPFWPGFPAAGWGVGLGVHWQLSTVAAQRRADRARSAPRTAVARPVAAPALPAADGTRFVVAMFVDVVGSTSLNEAMGDVRWAALRASFRSLVGDALAAHGGWEVNTAGDGVLARFHDPASAADAAVEVMRRLERQRAGSGFAPSVRIGIHSGDAVEDGGDIIGNVVNLACRVSDAADEDEVLVTEHVADHLDGRHETRGTGLHTLKGIARPRHLLALDWR